MKHDQKIDPLKKLLAFHGKTLSVERRADNPGSIIHSRHE
jgi:hypothetical protein